MPTRVSISEKTRRLVLGGIAIVFSFLALVSWGFSSPMGSSPDDNYHLASIWCGDGIRDNICEVAPQDGELLLPKLVYESPSCFNFKAEQSAECQEVGRDTTYYERINVSILNNTERLYPPVFYAVTGLTVTQDPTESLWSVRILNSALAVLLYAAIFIALPRKTKHLPVWALTVTAVPLSMFIIPSTNPSSWAVIGSAALLFSLIGYYTTEGKRRIALAILAIVSTVIMAGSRADAAMYAGIALVAAMIISARTEDLRFPKIWLPLVITGISVALFLTSNQVGSASGGLTGAEDLSLTTATLITQNLIMVPLLWIGVFGSTGLGWLDTAMPETAWISSLVGFLVLVFLGLNRLKKRSWIAGLLVLAALWIFPTYVLVRSKALVGALVQPRYLLPLIVILAGILIYRVAGKTSGITRISVAVGAVGLLAIAHSLSLHRNLKRYVTGVDVSGWNLDAQPEWWWDIPISPMTLWLIGSISFAVFLMSLFLLSPINSFGISQQDHAGPAKIKNS